MLRWGIAFIVLTAALAAAALWVLEVAGGPPAAGDPRPAAEAAPPAPAPVAPPDPAEMASLASLRALIDGTIERTGWRDVRWSVLVVSVDRGDTLYARDPRQVLAPASNMKLITTALALEHLGPDYRYTTFLVTDGEVRGGVLYGNVFLYGTGDPTLGQRFQPTPAGVLEAFADTLAALGIRRIEGDVVGDGSYFQGPIVGAAWDREYINAWWAPPAGALSVHENLVRIEVTPADRQGWRPELEFVPGGRGIAVVNLAVTGGGGGARVRRIDYPGPIVVEGRVGGRSSYAVPVSDPARYSAAVFYEALAGRDIAVAGTVREVVDPTDSVLSGRRVFAAGYEDGNGEREVRVLAVRTSEPLRDMLRVVNERSHNFYAEQVLRSAARAATGEGSIAAAERASRALLLEAGADTAGLRVADGSGLSPLSRVSAGQFVALLRHMAESPVAAEFESTLPVAGRAPRFRRMGGTPADGNLRAKTGTITRVSSLSGYVTTADGERVAFSIISNDVPSTARTKYIENAIGAALARFSRRGVAAPGTDNDVDGKAPDA